MNLRTLLLSIGLAGTIMSCSRKEDVQPVALATSTSTAQVKVVDGRLVFTDQKALDQVRNELRDLAKSTSGTKALAAWEKTLNFTSLRANAAKEEANLEMMETQGQATRAHNLMNSFGFPSFLASIINPSGEYQVGNKVYWFHDEFKYQANSETELAAIKQNPSSAITKSHAGLSIMSFSKKPLVSASNLPTSTTNRVIEGDDPYADNRYNNYYFNLNGDPGSQRRIIYDIHIYTEDDGDEPGGYYHDYYTVLYLQIKYEYYANRSGAWYPAAGQVFDWQTQIGYDATASIPNQASSTTTTFSNLYQSNSYDNGIVMLPLSDNHLVCTTAQYVATSDIRWNFEINGSIQGHPDNDPSHNYLVSASPLW